MKTTMRALWVTASLAALARSAGMTAAPWAAISAAAAAAGPRVRLEGTPCCHHLVDEHGYTVVEQGDGSYAYGVDSSMSGGVDRTDMRRGLLLSTPRIRVGEADPRVTPLIQHLALSDVCDRRDRALAVSERCSEDIGAAGASVTARVGTLTPLVLMIRFKDHATRELPSVADLDVLFNAEQPHPELAPTGSVYAYFKAQSRGLLNMKSTLSGWIDVPFTEAEAAMGCSATCRSGSNVLHEAIAHALDAFRASGVNFKQFDADRDWNMDVFTVVHSGYGAEWGGSGYDDRVWSHKWSLTSGTARAFDGVSVRAYNVNPGLWDISGKSIGRLGVIAHEIGHFLGLPDLYDKSAPRSATVGGLDAMSDPWGLDRSQLYPGSLGAWSRVQLGWADVHDVDEDGRYEMQKPGEIYKLSRNYPSNEYLLVETRSNVSSVWDKYVPGGVIVWHIDMKKSSNSDEGYPGDGGRWPRDHYLTRVIQQDNLFEYERFSTWTTDPEDAWTRPDQVLGDITQPSLLSYEQLYKADADCRTTGNTLSAFSYNRSTGAASFEYAATAPVPCPAGIGADTARPTASPHPPTARPTSTPRPSTPRPTARPSTPRPSRRPTELTRTNLRRDNFCKARGTQPLCRSTATARRWCDWNPQIGGETINPGWGEGCLAKFRSYGTVRANLSAFSFCSIAGRRCTRRRWRRRCFFQADTQTCLPNFMRPA